MAQGISPRFCSLLPRRLLQYVAAVSAAMSFLLVGMILAWTSPMLPRLVAQDSPLPLTKDQASWVVLLLEVGGLVSPLPFAYAVNIVGRKNVLLSLTLPVIIGWLLVAFSRDIATLLVSRAVLGFGMSIAIVTCPIYIGEIAEDDVRGALGCLMPLLMNMGALFDLTVGPNVPYGCLAFLACLFAVLYLLMMLFMYESPYFLLYKGDRKQAEISLARLRGKARPDVQVELDAIQKTVMRQAVRPWELVTSKGPRRALIVMIGLIVVQQFGAVAPFMGSAKQICAEMPVSKWWVAVAWGIQVKVGLTTMCLVDRLGRRLLLFASTFGCAACLAVMGAYEYVHLYLKLDTSSCTWLPLACLVTGIVFYTVGIGTLPTVIAGEIFPLPLKSLALSLGAMLLCVCHLAAIRLHKIMAVNLGAYTAYWVFAAVSAAGLVFVLFLVPETKRKNLGRIVSELSGEGVLPNLT